MPTGCRNAMSPQRNNLSQTGYAGHFFLKNGKSELCEYFSWKSFSFYSSLPFTYSPIRLG